MQTRVKSRLYMPSMSKIGGKFANVFKAMTNNCIKGKGDTKTNTITITISRRAIKNETHNTNIHYIHYLIYFIVFITFSGTSYRVFNRRIDFFNWSVAK